MNQCRGIIQRNQRRCLKRETSQGYCIWHGPLCQALTNSNIPCKSMVREFREGNIYCSAHIFIPICRHNQHINVNNHPAEFEDHISKQMNNLSIVTRTTPP